MMVTELMQHNLLEVLEKQPFGEISLADRLHIAIQIALALRHLHSIEPPVFHLDLKPQNILVNWVRPLVVQHRR